MGIATNHLDTFARNPDGSWTPKSRVAIEGPYGLIEIGPGMAFHRGVQFHGIDLAAALDRALERRGTPD